MLSQKYINCFKNLLKYKLDATIYDRKKEHCNRYQATTTHNLFNCLFLLDSSIDYVSRKDSENVKNYILNSISTIQNNQTNTFEIYDSWMNNNLKYLDYFEDNTKKFFNDLLNVLEDDYYILKPSFYNEYKEFLNSNPSKKTRNIYLSQLEIHVTRLFNNFYYKWLENPYNFCQDINTIHKEFNIDFIPHDLASQYLFKLKTKLDDIDNLEQFIKHLENLVIKYKTINSPFINFEPIVNLQQQQIQKQIQKQQQQQIQKQQQQQQTINKIDYNTYTLNHLKQLCKDKNIQVKGNKQNYINALMTHK